MLNIIFGLDLIFGISINTKLCLDSDVFMMPLILMQETFIFKTENK